MLCCAPWESEDATQQRHNNDQPEWRSQRWYCLISYLVQWLKCWLSLCGCNLFFISHDFCIPMSVSVSKSNIATTFHYGKLKLSNMESHFGRQPRKGIKGLFLANISCEDNCLFLDRVLKWPYAPAFCSCSPASFRCWSMLIGCNCRAMCKKKC